MSIVEIRHYHLFGAIGGGAKGFNRGNARVGNMIARYRCIGSVDIDAAANRDFTRAIGVKATTMDLMSRKQYEAFHGHVPPAGWREATPDDIQRSAGGERPHIVFLSAPCKGFSGLLSETRSRTGKYQALNGLTERGMWLMLEAWKDDPPELVVFENVPRIANRGRHLLDRITWMLRAYGYAVAETTHDCGEIGHLAQSRKRFLMVARHTEKVPPFLYEPVKRPLRAVGDVLGAMLLPGDPAAGAMHRLPSLHWRTWVRLAFVEAGSDWRSLNRLAVDDGFLRDFAIEREWHRGAYGVRRWDMPAGTVTSRGTPSCGTFSVADPRFVQSAHWTDGQAYGVRRWDQPVGVINCGRSPGQGAYAVADPRGGPDADALHGKYRITPWEGQSRAVIGGRDNGAYAVADPRIEGERFNNIYKIIRWDKPSQAVAGPGGAGGGIAVADPRPSTWPGGKYRVTGFEEAAGAVIGASTTGNGAFAVADPRTGKDAYSGYGVAAWERYSRTIAGESMPSNGCFAVADPRLGGKRSTEGDYNTAAPYGVLRWTATAGAVAAQGSHDNGRWSVADPRLPELTDRLVAVIRSLDGTWHRPFTTLELAALQGLVDPEEVFELDGLSDSAWRERIGNAVPPPAAQAIASVMGETLLRAWSGEAFALSASPVWVRPIAVALMAAR